MITDLLMYFFIYGFLGWILEVVFHAIVQQKLVNRGFLNGMICPIYGIGMVILVLLLDPIKGSLVKLFFGAAILCSVLELITGFALKVIFHQRWWDYSNEKFNLGGYICLEFSVYWGIAGVIAIDGIHPLVVKLIGLLPHWGVTLIVSVLSILIIFDIIATIISIRGLNKEITHIDEMGDMIKAVSDEITEMLYDGSKDAMVALEKHRPEFEQKKKELADLTNKAEEKKKHVAKNMSRSQRRLIKAFPNFENLKHKQATKEVKEKLFSHTKKD